LPELLAGLNLVRMRFSWVNGGVLLAMTIKKPYIPIQNLKIPPQRIRREEIRGMLVKMKFCSDCIFQGGDIEMAWKHLWELNNDEERRFLFCHTLVAGDYIDKSAAKALLLRLNPNWRRLEDVLPTLPEVEREEILTTKSVMDKFHQPQTMEALEDKDEKRISMELSKAVNEIGSLSYEEVLWIIISGNEGEGSLWVQGRKEQDKIASEEKLKLFSSFREARWVLHVHNHPAQYMKGVRIKASASDRSFSICWKQERPDLEHKMKFFIVAGKEILEYSMIFNKTRMWNIN